MMRQRAGRLEEAWLGKDNHGVDSIQDRRLSGYLSSYPAINRLIQEILPSPTEASALLMSSDTSINSSMDLSPIF
jgi:hypothetical protein